MLAGYQPQVLMSYPVIAMSKARILQNVGYEEQGRNGAIARTESRRIHQDESTCAVGLK